MRKVVYAMLFWATLALGCVSCSNDDDDGFEYVDKIELTSTQLTTIANCNHFGFKMLNVVSSSDEFDGENLIFSPISFNYAFSMLANGANGDTRHQLMSALGYDDVSINDVNELNYLLNHQLGALDSEVTVKFANSVWAKPYINILNSFATTLSSSYNAEIRSINDNTFVNDINSWCSSRTNGKITDFLTKGSPIPSFALYNAVYFKGIWTADYKFDNRQTREGYFNDMQGSRSVAKYMKQEVTDKVGSRIYGKTETLQKCELSFGNGSFGAAFILPDEGVSINQAIENLANGDWEKLNKPYTPILEICHYITVQLTLPKFKIESEINFNQYKYALGMGEVFGDKADYSNITENDIIVNDVKQKATFEIDEEGAVVAAVTGSGVDWWLGPDEYENITLTFDRPFIYVIHEHSTGAILFAGCVNTFAK